MAGLLSKRSAEVFMNTNLSFVKVKKKKKKRKRYPCFFFTFNSWNAVNMDLKISKPKPVGHGALQLQAGLQLAANQAAGNP